MCILIFNIMHVNFDHYSSGVSTIAGLRVEEGG